jgi:hypothetical protein
MAAPAGARILLGKRAGVTTRERVFRRPDAIEVDEAEGYDVSTRRVFFDEVQLVTYHQKVGTGFVVTLLVLLTFFGFVTLVVAAQDGASGGVTALLSVLPLLVLLVLRLVLKVDVITVFGPRTKVELHFWFRKARARQAYQQITRLVRERQQRILLARRPPAPKVPAAPIVPPAPDAAST